MVEIPPIYSNNFVYSSTPSSVTSSSPVSDRAVNMQHEDRRRKQDRRRHKKRMVIERRVSADRRAPGLDVTA